MKQQSVNGLKSRAAVVLSYRPLIGHLAAGLLQASVLTALPLLACAAADGPWSASFAATTDYIFRGVSQTYDRGALQLGANYQGTGGWFAGAWGSRVAPYPIAQSALELDLYTGISRPLGDEFTASVSYTHYMYLDDPRPERFNYDELAVAASYLDRIVATISYQPDSTLYSDLGFASRRSALAYEAAGRWPLPHAFALEAGAGYYDLHRLFGVRYWAADVGAQYVFRCVSVDLSRYFADSTVSRLYGGASANGTWVLSALVRLSFDEGLCHRPP